MEFMFAHISYIALGLIVSHIKMAYFDVPCHCMGEARIYKEQIRQNVHS